MQCQRVKIRAGSQVGLSKTMSFVMLNQFIKYVGGLSPFIP